VNVKRITNLTVVVVFACLMIAFCAGSVTTFADEHATDLCAQCGESNDGHVGAITVEHDGEHQTFCCPSCATKYANAHHDGSHHEDEGHHEHDEGHDEHKGHDH
jgi:hypothetical protein